MTLGGSRPSRNSVITAATAPEAAAPDHLAMANSEESRRPSLSVCMAQFITQAGLGMSITPVYITGDSFGATNPANLSWFAAAYSLTVGTFILVAGRLGDVFGHRNMFVMGLCWFSVWLCGYLV
ncbi:hypothetical protein N7447_006084 [Penicillium robsamsonii]|uniref:uncharacterized protein n=1 Tax=Penicillium robsamsonii TaxID=1792511 RepID=UPI002547785D|nr:uncharacterized protein N7447_006084 [Penicillium robsamsonii]KAJ5823744.1 hypothetical protein N7447_006084 [Penicillium robsamsonii]